MSINYQKSEKFFQNKNNVKIIIIIIFAEKTSDLKNVCTTNSTNLFVLILSQIWPLWVIFSDVIWNDCDQCKVKKKCV